MLASEENDPRKAGTIWMLDLGCPVQPVAPLVEADFCQVGPDDTADLVTAMGPGSMKEIRKRVEAGRRCYAAWVGGSLAAYGWVSFNEEFIGEVRLELRLQPGEAYIWDCVTLPDFRRKYLYSALLTFIAGELRAEGYRRAWIGANLDNLSSQRGIARAGFLHVADLVVSRVFALRMMWVQGAEGVPVSLVAEARRVFLNRRDQGWLSALTLLKAGR